MAAEDLPALICKATAHFIKVLDSEVHEKTLCYTLEMMSLWTSKITEEVPKALIDIFKVFAIKCAEKYRSARNDGVLERASAEIVHSASENRVHPMHDQNFQRENDAASLRLNSHTFKVG